MKPSMQLNHSRCTIILDGHIDETGAGEMKDAFNRIPFDAINELVLDFNHVTHIGSSGIGRVLLLYKQAAAHRCDVQVDGARDTIASLFRELKLDRLVKIN